MAVWQKVSTSIQHNDSVLFLDRDGVIIVDQDYLADPAKVVLLPGAAATIKKAREVGFTVIGISNQSGLGRGMFQMSDFELVMARMSSLLADENAALDGFYYCPHAPDDACACRKPEQGLLDEVSESLAWAPATSWVVGDKKSDITLARRAQMGGVLVMTGYGAGDRSAVEAVYRKDSCVLYANDLPEALQQILARAEMDSRGDVS